MNSVDLQGELQNSFHGLEAATRLYLHSFPEGRNGLALRRYRPFYFMPKSVFLHKGREKSLLRRHPWIFEGAVSTGPGNLAPGSTVDVYSADKAWLGRGAWSPESQIRVRIWSFDQSESVDNSFFKRRLQAALNLRAALPELQGCSAMRLVSSEADGLPGVTIDRYENALVMQLLSAGAEKQRDKILAAISSLLPECKVLERSDADIRRKEGLAPFAKAYADDMPDRVTYAENGLKFIANLAEGHKTGQYLDQRRNRLRLATYSKNRTVLNCFSYTGAIGVYCLQAGARHVVQADMSAEALEMAKENMGLNQCSADACESVKADVFKLLRQYRKEGRYFDMIILDPPKFVDKKQHLNRACRGYKDINLLALQLLNPGGILATFSCSGLLPEQLFHKVVADAALDAKRELHFLERLGQAADHPILASFPEGNYLKGLICRADESAPTGSQLLEAG